MASAEIPSFLGPTTRLTLRSWLKNFLETEAPVPGRSLPRPFTLEQQGPSEWCWAAVGSAVHRYLQGVALERCQVACMVKGVNTCCSNPQGCNRPDSLKKTLSLLGDLNPPALSGPLNAAQIDGQIAIDRPICCGLKNGQVGHFVVITGWFRSGVETILKVKDPAFGNGIKEVPLRILRQGYRGFTWLETYQTG